MKNEEFCHADGSDYEDKKGRRQDDKTIVVEKRHQ